MKKAIIDHLTSQGVYHSSYDFLIEILVHQVKIYKKAQKAIDLEGVSVSGNADGSFKVRNQNFRTISECIYNIDKLTKKLGLSVSDSRIIKELTGGQEDDDGFEDFQ